MLSGVHILLSYTCLSQCEHCFLHCSPMATGTFTQRRLQQVLDQAAAMDSVRHIVFEGGEPFLFYPTLLAGVAYAAAKGHRVEAITNAYWAQDAEDAMQWLRPLQEAGLAVLNISDDAYHHGDATPSPAEAARQGADALGLRHRAFRIAPPTVQESTSKEKGAPIVGGDVRFRGRAADTLTAGLPTQPWDAFTSCPDEEFASPKRVHVDAHGWVQLCQGIVIGNLWQQALSRLFETYQAEAHPICGPLHRGGPAALVRAHGLEGRDGVAGEYVDACHLCYVTRRALRETVQDHLAPPQAYGA